jgi:hypothetical protein
MSYITVPATEWVGLLHKVDELREQLERRQDLDFLVSVNQALHAVQSPWRIDRDENTRQAIAVPTPECFSEFETGYRDGVCPPT